MSMLALSNECMSRDVQQKRLEHYITDKNWTSETTANLDIGRECSSDV